MITGKVCSKCQQHKSFDDFYKWKVTSNSYMPECKECHKQRQREFRKNNKAHYNAWQKARRLRLKEAAIIYMGNKCFDCQIQYPSYIYDFHHLDGNTKEFNPGEGFNKTEEQLYNELDKCVMLCANCHRTRHYASE